MAEREGFEPSVRLPVRMISNHVPSAAQPPLLDIECCNIQPWSRNRKTVSLLSQIASNAAERTGDRYRGPAENPPLIGITYAFLFHSELTVAIFSKEKNAY